MPDFRNDVRRRLQRLHLEPTREAAIVEEMAQHLEQRWEEMVARGTGAEAARSAVIAELKDGTRLERELLQVERQAPVEPALPEGPGAGKTLAYLKRDLRYAVRTLRLNPGFSAVAILSLMLGIGANTAIFQLLDAVRLRSLPVRDPEELVQVKVSNSHNRSGDFRGAFPNFTYPIYEQLRDRQQALSGLAVWNSTTFNLAGGGRYQAARGNYVNGDFYRTLGVTAASGRLFSAADDQRGCGLPGAVISYAFWQKRFGGSPSAVGSKINLDLHAIEIIGVTAADFSGVEVGRGFDVALPLCSEATMNGEFSVLDRRDGWWLAILGRLNEGWTAEKATAHLEAISSPIFKATLPPRYQTELANHYLGWKLAAVPASSGLSGLRRQYEDPLWILLAIARSC